MYNPVYNSKKNGVPILSKEEIDSIGEGLVSDFCPQGMRIPMEIDIDRFVRSYLGMKQDFYYLSHNGIYLGMTVFNDTNRVIVYDPAVQRADYVSAEAGTVIIDKSLLADNQDHRYRFTVGHEGSHGILHTAYFGSNTNQLTLHDTSWSPIVQCRMDSSKMERKPTKMWADIDWMEWQANRLSSAILMPRSMVMKYINSMPQAKHIDYSTYITTRVSRKFNVSFEAAFYRLKYLGYISKAVYLPAPGSGLINILDVTM